jgi:hypothetical protein
MERKYRERTYPRKFLPVLDRYEPENMDHSATKVFKECPRKYFYRIVLGRTAPEGKWASVFAWGSSIHKFLELYYNEETKTSAPVEALKIFRSPTNLSFDFQDKDQLFLAFSLLMKMVDEEKKNGVIQVQAIEQPFILKFPDGINIGGRFDQIIKWNGRVWIRDWKTTSKQLQYFKAGLEPNDQAIRYIWAASCLTYGVDEEGYPNKVVDGVLFCAIYLNKTIASKKKGPEITNISSSRNKNQVFRWMKEQMFIHKQMEHCREEDAWPMHEVSCGFCDYRQVCNQPSEASMENMLKTHYVLSPWKHEETDQVIIKE